jgi:hypothetical protein
LKKHSIIRDYPITLSVSVNGLLANVVVVFRSEVAAVFLALFTGAVLVRGRHTVTRMMRAAGVRITHHAKFHRFFAQARWEMSGLWERLMRLAVGAFVHEQAVIELAGDDTAQRKTGGKIYGVGMVHDNRPHARKGCDLEWGLTWVTLTMMVRLRRWPEHVFALPVNVRLYRKEKVCRQSGRRFRTKPELLLDMAREVAGWLPGRRFLLHVDGGYGSEKLMKPLPPNMEVVGRLRYDAALYGRPPKRRHGRGRPRRRGERLPSPAHYVAYRPKQWQREILPDGQEYETQTWMALWWTVFGERPIRVVASRRPARGTHDHPSEPQFFYGTDIRMKAGQVVAAYNGRWNIECFFHEVKERMGFEEPQCRTERAVERTAPFLMWVAGMTVHWYLSQEKPPEWRTMPRWWSKKRRTDAPPAFSDMLRALRYDLMAATFLPRSASRVDLAQNIDALIEAAAYAA